MNLENTTILITGANRGIGRALVKEALKRGVKKVYAGTRSAFQHSDKRVTPLTLDVTNAEQVRRAVSQIDTLDILINNAGIAMYDDLTKPEVIEQHLAVNLFGPLNVTLAFLLLLKRSKGAVVNNLSTSALDDGYRTALVLLAAITCGSDTTRLACVTELPRRFVSKIRQRMIRAQLWTEKDAACDHWYRSDGAFCTTFFWLDVLVAEGHVVRRWVGEEGEYRYWAKEHAPQMELRPEQIM